MHVMSIICFFFQAEDGIRDLVRSRGLGDVYKRQINDTIYATWGDTRDGNLNIWFNKISALTLVGTGIQNIASESKELITIYPNPSSDLISIEYKTIDNILIYDILGSCVFQLNDVNRNLVNIDITHLQSGNYTVKIVGNNNKEISRQITKN